MPHICSPLGTLLGILARLPDLESKAVRTADMENLLLSIIVHLLLQLSISCILGLLIVLGIEARALCMLGKHCHWSTALTCEFFPLRG